MRFLSQPLDGIGNRLGDRLIAALDTAPSGSRLKIVVAFAKAGGVLRLAPALARFRARGGTVGVACGIDEGVTSIEGLRILMGMVDRAYVFSNKRAPSQPTFHPKFYLVTSRPVRASSPRLFVGSNNLTAGGLFSNYEACLEVALNLDVGEDRETLAHVLRAYRYYARNDSINSFALVEPTLEELIRRGHVRSEAESRAEQRVRESSIREPLFGRTAVPPAPPVERIDEEGWYEQRRRQQAAGPVRRSPEPVPVVEETDFFVMSFGHRDTQGQTPGFSPDIFIPLAARDFYPAFWRWPGAFALHETESGTYRERRMDILVQTPEHPADIERDVRLYKYDERSEFRLNCSALVRGSRVGDLLVVYRRRPIEEGVATPEYEAFRITPRDPTYQTFAAACDHDVTNSTKVWGYGRVAP